LTKFKSFAEYFLSIAKDVPAARASKRKNVYSFQAVESLSLSSFKASSCMQGYDGRTAQAVPAVNEYSLALRVNIFFRLLNY